MIVHGVVEEAFEPVREAFERGAEDLGRGGGAFSAYVGGRLVVDLWAGMATPEVPWTQDTTAILMSATKGMTALCAQILYDRGSLDVDERVSFYWPGFARRGKDSITVRQILSHTAGVIGVPGHERELGWDGSGFDDYDAIASWLEEVEPAWEPGTRCGYHALTYGWIVGELIRRIDGRTLGGFFDQEVATPLGLDARIGTPLDEQKRVALVAQDDLETRQRTAEAMFAVLPDEMRRTMEKLLADLRDPSTTSGQAFIARDGESVLEHLTDLMNSEGGRAAEMGASNGTATARSLAKMYAALALEGSLDGVTLVSPKSVEVFATQQVRGTDAVMGTESAWSLGYMSNIEPPGQPLRFGPSRTAFGHPGAGGQWGFADTENGVSVGFVRSHLATVSFFSTTLVTTLYNCLS